MCLGIPAKVVEVRRFEGLGLVEGKVDFCGVIKEINLSFTPEVEEGDYVVVHVGFSISIVDEEEALTTLQYLRELGELEAPGESPSPDSPLRGRTMRYVDEFRDPELAEGLLRGLSERATRRWNVMEVCGGQTHTLIRSGIDELVSDSVELIHGPGCPVCVTPLEKIDRAHAVARQPGSILCSYGDMVRVPGSQYDLLWAKAAGADLRIVYSPLDAVKIAQANPTREVVFFAVGFETTAPANAMAVKQAAALGLHNFSVIVSHVRVPPAISIILEDPDCRVNGFIAPGHVCSVMGFSEYEDLAARYGVPFVVAGFEPLDLLQGLFMLVDMLESGRAEVSNQYTRSVRRQGNPDARRVMEEVFEVSDMNWRGIGLIPDSGLRLREAYRAFDAEARFELGAIEVQEPEQCIAGEVLQGRKRPPDCPAFGKECTPEFPLGAPMVSSEGACAAYYAFRRHEGVADGV